MMKPKQQRLIGLLIESGIYKHPDGRHLYQLNIKELDKLCYENNIHEFGPSKILSI